MEAKETPRAPRWSAFSFGASGFLAAFMAIVYVWLPTELAAIFIWPFTLWVLVGVALVALARKSPPRLRWLLVGVWVVLWFGLDSQPAALLPRLPDGSYGDIVRIASLNCAGGNPAAAEEAVATGAQLILLQESPGADELEAIRARLGEDWSLVHGPDGSVLAKGRTRRLPLPRGTSNFVAVEWGNTLVISLRLQPPIFRLDYWSPACWQAFADNRRSRIKELREIVDWIQANQAGRDLIVGGDFNSPPDPVLMGDLENIASDAFAERGWGWGGTAINSFPIVRIDQVWLGGGIITTHSHVRITQHSDHRMVIVEYYRPT